MSFWTWAIPFAAFFVVTTSSPDKSRASEVLAAQVETVPSPQPTTPEKSEQCAVGETTRNDICAQWTAAEAAASTVNIGWGQLVVSVLTLGAAIVAAIYAKGAAREASSANEIARSTDRPWVFLDAVASGNATYVNEFIMFPFELTLRNDGNTPAIDVHIAWDAFQSDAFDLDIEYKRIVAKPISSEPQYFEPFRHKAELRLLQPVKLDRRNQIGLTVVGITVFYRSPHSKANLHTTVFYTLDAPLVAGQADRLHKATRFTKMV